ncbi:MAG: hypothetical protein P4L69_19285 [Desulfosporosinus sp.]|nr:hypothetical protein [Desulfosporosinus sp.]
MTYYVPGSNASEVSIDGVEELIAKLKELEKLPQSIVTKAAKTGANMALDFALANLQPVNGDFLGRQGRTEQHEGGDLAKTMNLKAEKSPKGKKVYRIKAPWYTHFKDLGFTSRSGKKIEGSHFFKYALTKHYSEIQEAIIEELSKGVDKVVGPK